MTSDPARPLLSSDLLDRHQHAPAGASGNGAATPSERHDTGGYHAPATVVEQMVADIYAQVLGLDRIGADESFFDLGGDSLSAMRAVALINAGLDSRLALRTLLDAPSVRALSRQLDRQAVEGFHAGGPSTP